jgi:hypothetical protein
VRATAVRRGFIVFRAVFGAAAFSIGDGRLLRASSIGRGASSTGRDAGEAGSAARTATVSGWATAAGLAAANSGAGIFSAGVDATFATGAGRLGGCAIFITTAPPKAPANTSSSTFTGFISYPYTSN